MSNLPGYNLAMKINKEAAVLVSTTASQPKALRPLDCISLQIQQPF